MSEQPWSFAEALDRCQQSSRNQGAVEDAVKESYRGLAEAEELYRTELAKELVRLHDEDGVAWTVCDTMARGNPYVARLRKARDLAEGVKEATTAASWRRNADRKDAQRFSDWSQRRELAEFHGREPAEAFGDQR